MAPDDDRRRSKRQTMNRVRCGARPTEELRMLKASTKAHTVAAREVGAILHLDAGHDTNGNPRRGYLVIGKREGWPVAYVDEGYRGPGALGDVIRGYTDPRWCGGVLPSGVYAPRKLPYPLHVPTKASTLREWRGKSWGDAS